jgi:DNA-binding beta-propeller fold protein YncE
MPKDHGTACNCASCSPEAYSRNNYFTGKLMVERDFTDEQRYMREKLRIHHQRLHGTGVVCGLKLRAHEPPCEDRYVILEPGSAVDCCGQDILVVREDVVDLHGFDAMQEVLRLAEDPETPADRSWDLQLCIRYAECPDEDVPVLYDECGCDDSRCAPNRILESYAVELRVNPAIAGPALHVPGLDWSATVGIDDAAQVAVDAGRGRAFVMTAGPLSVVHQVDTATLAIEASVSLGREGLAMAVGASGETLYLAAADPGGMGAGDARLAVFDLAGAGLGAGPVRTEAIPGSQGSALALRLLPDGRLLAVIEAEGTLRLWDAAVTGAPDDLGPLGAGIAAVHLVVMSDGLTVIAADRGTGTLHRVDLGAPGPAVDSIVLGEGVAHALALVPGPGADLLLVADATAEALRLVDLTGATIGTVALDHAPHALAVAPSGGFAYALVRDGAESFVQVVPLQPLRNGATGVAAQPVPVGARSGGIVLAGSRLWLSYLGADDAAASGGVAVIGISEADCRAILMREDCPECDCGDCLVLATIRDYRPGDRILDRPDPPAYPADGTAQIDNDLGRKRLPSTQAIAEALLCLLDTCCGNQAPAEPPPAPEPEPEPEPDPFSPPTVTRICGISWPHLGVLAEADFPTVAFRDETGGDSVRLPGFAIAFDRETDFYGSLPAGVLAAEDERTMAAYASRLVRLRVGLLADTMSAIAGPAYTLWAEVPALTLPVALELSPLDAAAGTCRIEEIRRFIRPDDDLAAMGLVQNGVFVAPAANISAEGLHRLFFRQILNEGSVQVPEVGAPCYRFELAFDGHALIDVYGRPVDAPHVAPFLPARPSGTGWQGGVFESAFFYNGPPEFRRPVLLGPGGLTPTPGPGQGTIDEETRIAVNRAGLAALTTLPGVGRALARTIIAARPIRDAAALRTIHGIGPSLAARIAPLVTFD